MDPRPMQPRRQIQPRQQFMERLDGQIDALMRDLPEAAKGGIPKMQTAMALLNVDSLGLVKDSMQLTPAENDALNRMNADLIVSFHLGGLSAVNVPGKPKDFKLDLEKIADFFRRMKKDFDELSTDGLLRVLGNATSRSGISYELAPGIVHGMFGSTIKAIEKRDFDGILNKESALPLVAVFQEMYDLKLERMLGPDALEYRERTDVVNRIIQRKLVAMMPPDIRKRLESE